jgi:S-adenosylmethionine/arginine decarboxylase-like enzyme
MKHKHLIVRAEVSNPPRYEENIVDWTKNLIRDIGMKIMMGPYAKYCTLEGNKGYTCITVIETSHVAIHIWDEPSPKLIQLDVYTCSDLDINTIFDALEKFDPVKIDYKYLDRESNLTEVLDTK